MTCRATAVSARPHLLVDGLAQAEVRQLHVAVAVEKKVVGLDVAVDEVGGVHRLLGPGR